MTKLLKTYKPFDIIVVPFPFSDLLEQKKRPALVLSSEEFNNDSLHLVTAMITSAKSVWPFDTRINVIKNTGLSVPCLVRLKFYTVDQNRVIKTIGRLGKCDRTAFKANLMAAINV